MPLFPKSRRALRLFENFTRFPLSVVPGCEGIAAEGEGGAWSASRGGFLRDPKPGPLHGGRGESFVKSVVHRSRVGGVQYTAIQSISRYLKSPGTKFTMPVKGPW